MKKKWNILSAVTFLALTIVSIYSTIEAEDYRYLFNVMLLQCIGFGLITIGAFYKNILVSSVGTILNVPLYVKILIENPSANPRFLASCILIIIYYLMILIISNGQTLSKIMGTVAAGIAILWCIMITIADMDYAFNVLRIVRYVISAIMLAVGAIFLGKVFYQGKRDRGNTENSKQSLNTTEDIVEKLTTLKALLDEGIISQEEFDNKKKQILNL